MTLIVTELSHALLVTAGVWAILSAMNIVRGWAKEFDSDWGAK